MKKIVLIFAFILPVLALHAQIQFEHLTLSEAIAKAKKEKKPIFVDVYATWCGPCKRMAATAFVDAGVTELYNKNFINVKIDGEKNDGPSVMQQYGISAYPTLLYINADGTLFRKVVGMMDVPALMAKGNEALHPETSPVFVARKQYYSSDKGEEALKMYISTLAAEQDDSLEVFTLRYYKMKRPLNLQDDFDFFVFYQQETDFNSANGQYFLNHASEFDSQSYTGKIKEWINGAFSAAVEQQDYTIVEKAVEQLFPYWEKAENIGQTKEEYLQYVKTQYNRYAGR